MQYTMVTIMRTSTHTAHDSACGNSDLHMPSDGSLKLSEKEADMLALRLLRRASDILGAVVWETTYVECSISVIRADLDGIMRDVEVAYRALKSGSIFSRRNRSYGRHRKSICTINMLYVLCGLAVMNSKLLHGNELRPQVVTASSLINEAIALVSRAMEVFRHRSVRKENIVCLYRNRPPYGQVAPGVSCSHEMATLISAFIDALDMIIVNTENFPEMVKESLLGTSAAFICASRCMEEDLFNTMKYGSRAMTGAVSAMLTSADNIIEFAQHNFVSPFDSTSAFAFQMAQYVIVFLQNELQKSNHSLFMGKKREEKLPVTLYYGLLQSTCRLGLLWYTCKKQGLDPTSAYVRSIHQAHLLVHNVLEKSYEVLGVVDDSIVCVDFNVLILSNLEIAQKNLYMHCVPSCPDQEKLLNLTQLANEAINWTCGVCVEHVKQIYDTGENLDTSVGTSVDIQSVVTHVAPEERGGGNHSSRSSFC